VAAERLTLLPVGAAVQFVRISAVGFSLFFLAGCGGDRFENRVEVSGQVRQGNTPLAAGSIVFIPESGSGGPGAEGKIVDGQYRIEQSVGPVPGPHRVVIAPQRAAVNLMPTGKTRPPKGPGPWQFEVEIPAGETFVKDFELRSRK